MTCVMCNPWKKTFTLTPLAPFFSVLSPPNTVFGSCNFKKLLPKQKNPKPWPKHIEQKQLT
jgi:hypothetical protein